MLMTAEILTMAGTNVQTQLSLPVAMLLIFGAAKVLAELFERMRQPGIIGEILAGVVIGPSILNWITPNESVSFLAELGVIFLLFRVGLEVKSTELIKVGRTAAVVGVMGVALPMVCGWGLYRLISKPNIEALFVGAALTATSVGITAQVLASKGVLSDIAGRIILAAAIIDDVLALLVLGVISAVAQGDANYLELGLTSFFAVLFVLLVVRWGEKAAVGIFSAMERSLRIRDGQYALAMIIMFALAALSAKAGVAPIIGAFLAGMAMSDGVTPRVHELTQGAAELLIPFFLVNIGLHLDVSVFRNRSTLVLGIVVLLVAVVAKIAGCGLGALGHGRMTALRVGLGMVPRGEFCFAVVQVGLMLRAIPPQTYGVVVFMAVVSTLLTPVFLKMVFGENAPQ